MKYTFETALTWLKRGYKARRTDWDEAVFIFINPKGQLTGVSAMGPWPCTLEGEDVLADDWVVEE